jgi:hypothetical protein
MLLLVTAVTQRHQSARVESARLVDAELVDVVCGQPVGPAAHMTAVAVSLEHERAHTSPLGG